ncbi:unnamed protein product [Gongylonema pulchrum]|uniref:HEPN domain-containing protein n=1 Tax=Gongylonema pulchrum TaxID=637853 RepID=A0A183DYL5_9BILA|nr:unnamed protein product [Gongylonema pulchrum]
MEEKNRLWEALEDIDSVFGDLSQQWANACFEENFSDFGAFSNAVQFSILQALDYSARLAELCSRLLLYVGKADRSTEIWAEMAESGYDAKKLCVFAWYLIERGQQPDA